MSSLCWTVSNNYSDTAKYDEKQQTKSQRLSMFLLHQVYFMLTTILHHITHD